MSGENAGTSATGREAPEPIGLAIVSSIKAGVPAPSFEDSVLASAPPSPFWPSPEQAITLAARPRAEAARRTSQRLSVMIESLEDRAEPIHHASRPSGG